MKRTDLLKWSEVAATKLPSVAVREQQRTIRMRDMPAVNDLERHLLLYGSENPEVEQEIPRVCRYVFGIEPSETRYEMPAEYWNLRDYDLEKHRLYNLWAEYEYQFETGDDLTDDETVEVLARLGLDFTDERGQPLRCTKLFSRAAEFAAKGIKGKLPDAREVQLAKFEDVLTRQRDAFLANKRKR